MIYLLRFHGGFCDGEEILSARPYTKLKQPDGSIYASDDDGERAGRRIDGDTVVIELRHRPDLAPAALEAWRALP